MKTLRILSFAVIVILLGINFNSCSKSDSNDGLDADIEGSWGVTHIEGWESYGGEKDTFSSDYNPQNPTTGDEEKIDIINTTGNTYLIQDYYYSTSYGKWRLSESLTATLKGRTFTFDVDDETVTMKILSVTSSRLVVEINHSTGDFYSKATFRRME